jgi:lipopolysaccharide export system permease protein
MIFKRALREELGSTAGSVFTVLFSIMFSVALVRILGEAAGGRVDGDAVLALVALAALTWLPAMLALTLFVTVLMTLSRAWRDSEMAVWFSSGQSLLAWVPQVLRFAAPIIGVVAALTLFGSPWAERQIAESRERFLKRDDISKVAPGRFIESGSADRTFFVEDVDLQGSSVRNVFVSHRSQGREGVIVAARGVIEVTPDGDRFLVLERGRRYEGTPGEAEYRMAEFERYSIRLDARPASALLDLAARAKPTPQLLRERNPWHDAELVRRFGMPVVTLILALMAIPLSYTNPRLGRSLNLIIAVLVFFVYLNGQSLMQGYVKSGALPLELGVWILHAGAAAVMVLLFARRLLLRQWLPPWLWPGYRKARQAARVRA